jgi:hypothetical protein
MESGTRGSLFYDTMTEDRDTLYYSNPEEPSMDQTDDAKKLADVIVKAIDDLELTTSEYHDIMAQAAADGRIDPDDARLLNELQRLIDDGVVKRVSD